MPISEAAADKAGTSGDDFGGPASDLHGHRGGRHPVRRNPVVLGTRCWMTIRTGPDYCFF